MPNQAQRFHLLYLAYKVDPFFWASQQHCVLFFFLMIVESKRPPLSIENGRIRVAGHRILSAKFVWHLRYFLLLEQAGIPSRFRHSKPMLIEEREGERERVCAVTSCARSKTRTFIFVPSTRRCLKWFVDTSKCFAFPISRILTVCVVFLQTASSHGNHRLAVLQALHGSLDHPDKLFREWQPPELSWLSALSYSRWRRTPQICAGSRPTHKLGMKPFANYDTWANPCTSASSQVWAHCPQ